MIFQGWEVRMADPARRERGLFRIWRRGLALLCPQYKGMKAEISQEILITGKESGM